jgi:hypothetical protein
LSGIVVETEYPGQGDAAGQDGSYLIVPPWVRLHGLSSDPRDATPSPTWALVDINVPLLAAGLRHLTWLLVLSQAFLERTCPLDLGNTTAAKRAMMMMMMMMALIITRKLSFEQ